MTAFAEITIKLSIIILCGLLAARLLRTRSAALRHWVLSVAFLSAAAAPLLTAVLPVWPEPVRTAASLARFEPVEPSEALQAELSVAARRSAQGPTPVRRSFSVPSITMAGALTAVWMAGAAISLGVLVIGFVRLTRRASLARPIADARILDLVTRLSRALGVRRPILALQSDDPALLVTWGFAPAKVILPSAALDWPDDRLRVVVAHELAHIQRRDWVTQMPAEALRALCWFNPLVGIACRRLRRESEQACDDMVLALGVAGSDYASHLLDLARSLERTRRPWLPVLAMAHTDSLERRIKAMLNAQLNRRPLTRAGRLAAALAVVGLTVSIAGFQPLAQALSTFSGSVFDSTGRVVPDATLALLDVQTNAVYQARSDQTGRFEFPGLPAGSYVLENLTLGFRKQLGKLKLAGQQVQQDVTLQVGTLQETITIRGERGAPPDSASAPMAGRRVQKRDASSCVSGPAGGMIRTPTKVRDVRPVYPQALVDAGVAGTVVLDAIIGTDGMVREANLVGNAHPGLAAAATEAVRQWEFDSTLLNCVAIEVSMVVTANFTIAQ